MDIFTCVGVHAPVNLHVYLCSHVHACFDTSKHLGMCLRIREPFVFAFIRVRRCMYACLRTGMRMRARICVDSPWLHESRMCGCLYAYMVTCVDAEWVHLCIGTRVQAYMFI